MSWIPSLTTVLLSGFVVWLCRNSIKEWLTKSIAFSFDKKLEALRQEHRESQARLDADLRAKQAEIDALRSGAMTALSSRQIAVDKRTLEAIDQLWAAMISLNKARGVAQNMATFNFEVAAERAQHDPAQRSEVEKMAAGFNVVKDIDLTLGQKAQPYLTPMAWAIFTTFFSILVFEIMRWDIARRGLGTTAYRNNVILANLVKAALPEISESISKHGLPPAHMLANALEQKMIAEFKRIMKGAESDAATVKQAAEILNFARELSTSTNANAGAAPMPFSIIPAAPPLHD